MAEDSGQTIVATAIARCGFRLPESGPSGNWPEYLHPRISQGSNEIVGLDKLDKDVRNNRSKFTVASGEIEVKVEAILPDLPSVNAMTFKLASFLLVLPLVTGAQLDVSESDKARPSGLVTNWRAPAQVQRARAQVREVLLRFRWPAM
jgi:hypothetical protein